MDDLNRLSTLFDDIVINLNCFLIDAQMYRLRKPIAIQVTVYFNK